MDTQPTRMQEGKNRNWSLIIAAGIVVVLIGIGIYQSRTSNEKLEADQGAKSDLIRVTNPLSNEAVQSPLTVEGEARGPWYFEASFPVKLLDENGEVLAAGVAEAEGDWMTEAFVPFRAKFEFTAPATPAQQGTLVLEKSNPSGLASTADELRIPVAFMNASPSAESPAPTMTEEPSMLSAPPPAGITPSPAPQAMTGTIIVRAYFGNSKLNSSADCANVFPVAREIPKTTAVGKAALEELLKGPTAFEQNWGYSTNLNGGVKLKGLKIENGVARADFDGTLGRDINGSCRVTGIRAEITKTLKQFPTVKNVVISIDDRTEGILEP